MQRHQGGYYIRLTVHDRPGVAAGVATRMAEGDISLESILQKRSETAAIEGSARALRRACAPRLDHLRGDRGGDPLGAEKISGDGLIAEPPQVIRIERE